MFNQKIHLSKYKEFLEKIVNKNDIEQQGSYKLVFKCPICGDSKKNPRKRRGFLLSDSDGKATVGCLNCDYRASFYYFLKENFPNICKDWLMDVLIMNPTYTKQEEELAVETCYVDYSDFIHLKDNTHEAVRKATIKLINHRRLPKKYAKNFYYSYQGKFVDRLIIPYYMRDGSFKYFEARDLTGKSLQKYKFPTAMPQEFYNLCFIDKTKLFFIFEGVFDSLFVENSVAIGGVSKIGRLLNDIDPKYYENMVIVFDGDSDGIQKAYKMLKKGFKVFIWNNEMLKHRKDGKIDINQLVMEGFFDEVLDDDGQIPVDELMKYVVNSSIESILDFEFHYSFTHGIELEKKKEISRSYNVEFVKQKGFGENKGSGNTWKSGVGKRFHS